MSKSAICCFESGDEGVVLDICCSQQWSQRAQELGIVPGTWFRVVQHGCPMLLQIGNARVSLRKEDAAHIKAECLVGNP